MKENRPYTLEEIGSIEQFMGYKVFVYEFEDIGNVYEYPELLEKYENTQVSTMGHEASVLHE